MNLSTLEELDQDIVNLVVTDTWVSSVSDCILSSLKNTTIGISTFTSSKHKISISLTIISTPSFTVNKSPTIYVFSSKSKFSKLNYNILLIPVNFKTC